MMEKKSNCGVYGIWNVTRNKIYIGSTNNIHKREAQHLRALKNGTHTNKELQADFDNNDVFRFIPLWYGDPGYMNMARGMEYMYMAYMDGRGLKLYNKDMKTVHTRYDGFMVAAAHAFAGYPEYEKHLLNDTGYNSWFWGSKGSKALNLEKGFCRASLVG